MPDLMAFWFSKESQPLAQVRVKSRHVASSPRHRVPGLLCKMLEYRCLVSGLLSLCLSLLIQKKNKSLASYTMPSLTKAKQQACQELEQYFMLGCAKFQVNLDF